MSGLAEKVSAYLAKETPWFITAVAVVTYLDEVTFAGTLPPLFAWVRGGVQTSILGLIMLTMGMTLAKEDFRILFSRPLDIAIGSLAQFSIMPLVALSLSHFLSLPKEIAVGLILVGCSPGGVSSNIMSFLCKGDVAFSVGITSLSTLLAPLTTPLLMLYLAGESVDVDAVGMFKSILLVTLMPIAVGFTLNALFGAKQWFVNFKKLLPGIAVIALAAIVGGVVSAQGGMLAKTGALIFLAVFLHNSLGYVFGYLTGVVARFTNAKKRTIAIEVGMQNAGLATVLASTHFPAMPETAIASAVSCVWHSISGALLAGVFNLADRLFAGRDLRGRTVVITGASSGIGAALSVECARRGASRLFLCARNAERLAAVAAKCREAAAEARSAAPAVRGEADALAVIAEPVDVTDERATRAWIERCGEAAPLDYVFANAGVATGLEIEPNIRRTFATNIGGVLNVALPAIAAFRKQSAGERHLVMTASIAGYAPLSGCPSYSATKAAVKTWGLAMRGHLRKEGIKVSVICPGFVRSAITDMNTCPMPFFMEAPEAAKIILSRVLRNVGLIAFPWPMRLAVWSLSCLPASLLEFVAGLLPAKRSGDE